MTTADVIIAGGGLAGLSLASQLKDQLDSLDIVVIEKNRFPVPEAVAKVGESTVEVGSYYLKDIVGLSQHFEERHLRKFGLRCFLGPRATDLADFDELGTSGSFNIPTYQIDRGVVENHLMQMCLDKGVRVIDGATTLGVTISPGQNHRLRYQRDARDHAVEAKWLVDASGRRALVKTALDLAEDNDHRCNAAWFRVNRRVELDDWSSDPDWQRRIDPPRVRWLSTNHLMGPGYWVWVIPLSSGATSFGIVMDDQALADSGIVDLPSTLQWLEQHHPLCARSIDGAEFMDFVLAKDFSYGTRQSFSDQRWATTGEAGVFIDPFYSPGSDFIGIANGFVARLISDDCSGRDIRVQTAVYNRIYRSLYAGTLSVYQDQYGGFGDRKMMGLKLLWDYAYYWGVIAWLFFNRAMTDVELMRSVAPDLEASQAIGAQVHAAFRQRAAERRVLPSRKTFMDQCTVPVLAQFNRRLLHCEQFDTATQLRENIEMLRQLAPIILTILDDGTEANDINDLERELIGEYRSLVIG